jgi:hypothetical protein
MAKGSVRLRSIVEHFESLPDSECMNAVPYRLLPWVW